MIQSDKWILEIRGMRSRKSYGIVQDNQIRMTDIFGVGTLRGTHKKTLSPSDQEIVQIHLTRRYPKNHHKES